jgi:uncharacterized protein (DUF2141 family)
MRYFYLITTVLFFSFSVSAAELTVQLTGVNKAKGGNIMLAVYENQASFLKEDSHLAFVRVSVANAKDGIITTQFDLKIGQTYAIAAYHDANRNNQLDKNLFGIPKEGYGFSNNARGTFGPPSFEKAAFQFTADNRLVSFYLSY